MHRPLVVLGAGPAGLACASLCDAEHLVIDATDRLGGLASVVEESNGFLFQPALPLRYDSETPGDDATEASARVHLYQGKSYLPCPFEIAPDGLPRESERASVARSLLQKAGMPPRRSLRERVRQVIARPARHGPQERAIARPKVQLFELGLQPQIDRASRAVWTRARLESLDIDNHELTCSGRPPVRYDFLVSSIPLPELVARTIGVRESIRAAAALLRSSDSMTVNIGVAGHCTDRQVVYYADPEVIFFRVVAVSNLLPDRSPLGTTSLNIEVASPSDRPIARAGIIRRVLTDLIQVRMLRPSDRILHMSVHESACAYPLDDDVSRQAVAEIQAWYRERGVLTIGRGGLWQRLGIEAAAASGATAVTELGMQATPDSQPDFMHHVSF